MSITETLEKVSEAICNNYCKYPEIYEHRYFFNKDEGFEAMIKEQCENCPLTDL